MHFHFLIINNDLQKTTHVFTKQLVIKTSSVLLRAMETDLIMSDLLCVFSDLYNMILVWSGISISCFQVLISQSKSLPMLPLALSLTFIHLYGLNTPQSSAFPQKFPQTLTMALLH